MKITNLVGGIPVPKDIDDRIGRFQIDSSLVQSDFEIASRVLRGIVILRAEHLLAQHAIEYTGIAPFFETHSKGGELPLYVCTVTQVWGRIHSVTWKKSDGWDKTIV